MEDRHRREWGWEGGGAKADRSEKRNVDFTEKEEEK